MPERATRPAGGEIDDAVLDAARRCLLRAQGGRVGIVDIAREAGVSRPTVYRRWPDVAAIIADLLTRDMTRVLRRIPGEDAADLDELVDGFVAGAVAVDSDELLAMLWATRPAALTPYLVERVGRTQVVALDLIAAAVDRGQRAGHVRAGDARVQSAMVLLLAQAAVTSRRTLAAEFAGASWTDELAIALRGYLAPLERQVRERREDTTE